VKVVLDRGRCEGNAICAALAPDVFEMDADDLAEVSVPEPDEARRQDVQRAVDACPRTAISIGG
jgi:ferredoxin